jgi:hypothetical protein
MPGNDAEILGDERHRAELRVQRREQPGAAARAPLPEARRLGPRRHLPIRLEGAKVVDAHDIEARELRAHPIQPPAETAALHGVPVVQRVTPELTLGVEIVRRYAGHAARLAARVEREEAPVPPNLDAITIDVERQIAEEVNAALVGIALQSRPLQLEQVLLEHEGAKLLAIRRETGAQRRGVALAELRGPLPPRQLVEASAQELEQSIRQEPPATRADEICESAALLRVGQRSERRVACVAPSSAVEVRREDHEVGEILGSDEARIPGICRP